MASCVTCHEAVVIGLTERGRILPLHPAAAPAGRLAVKPSRAGGLCWVRYLRGGAAVKAGELRMVAHWDLHPECKPARPRRANNRPRGNTTREMVSTC